MANESRYDILIRTDAELDALKQAQGQLREVTGAAKEVGAEAPVAAEKLGQIEQALAADKVGRYAKSLEDLAAKERAAGRATDELERELRGLESAAGDAEKGTGGFGAVLAGSFVSGLALGAIAEAKAQIIDLSRSAIDLADHLGDLSDRTGVAVPRLQAIGNAASTSGGSIDGVANAISKLTLSQQSAEAGSKAMAAAFARLGFDIAEIKDTAPDELFLRIADAVKNSTDRGRTYANVVAVMGRESVDLFSTLATGRDEIIATGKAMGTFSEGTVRELKAAKDELAKFQNLLIVITGNTLGAATRAVRELGDAAPAELLSLVQDLQSPLSANAQFFTRMAAAAKELKAETANTGDGVREAAKHASDLALAFDKAAIEAGKIEAAFAKRSLEKLPLELQANVLQNKLADLREEAQKLAGTDVTFGNAADFYTIAAGLEKGRDAAVDIAVEMAKIEDAIDKVAEAQKKLTDAEKKDAERRNATAERERAALEKKKASLDEILAKHELEKLSLDRQLEALKKQLEVLQAKARALDPKSLAGKENAADIAKVEDAIEKVIAAKKREEEQIERVARAGKKASSQRIAEETAEKAAIDATVESLNKKIAKLDQKITEAGPSPDASPGEFRDAKQKEQELINRRNQLAVLQRKERDADAAKFREDAAQREALLRQLQTGPVAPAATPPGTQPPAPNAPAAPAAVEVLNQIQQRADETGQQITQALEAANGGFDKVASAAAKGLTDSAKASEAALGAIGQSAASAVSALAESTARADQSLQLALDAAVRRIATIERRI